MNVAAATTAGLGAAGCFGLGTALQHAQAEQEVHSPAWRPALVRALVRRPVWVLGAMADVAAVVLQAVGLHFGSVALVQSLLVAGLPVAVVLSCVLARRRPRQPEVYGVLLCVVGLGLLVPATSAASVGAAPHRVAALVAAGGVAAGTGALLGAGRRWPAVAGPLTGAAAGVLTGAASVLLAVCAGRVGDLGALMASLAPYAAVGVAGLALAVSQAAFQTGALGAPFAAMSLTEPAVAVALAVSVLHQRLSLSPATALEAAVAVLFTTAGIAVLASSAMAAQQPSAGTGPAT